MQKNRIKKSTIYIVGIIIAGVAALAIYFQLNQQLPETDKSHSSLPMSQPETMPQSAETEPVKPLQPETEPPKPSQPDTAKAPTAGQNDQLDAIADICKEKYGQTLYHPRTQIAMLEKLISYFKARHPSDWQDSIRSFLFNVFPDQANDLWNMMEKLLAYNTWREEKRIHLAGLPMMERRELTWQRRREIFGDDADTIWEKDLKNETIYNALNDLGSEDHRSFGEKVDHYLNAVSEAYEEQANEFIKNREQELLDAFLTVESVQADLHQMNPEERKQALSQFRSQMGIDKDAIVRLEELDEIRDQRWETGEQYMEARKKIVAEYKGTEQDEKLDALRNEFFGPVKAETIKGEEKADFLRFERRRIYGKN